VSPSSSRNLSSLNDIYQSLADSNPGVTYADAGQAVMANGQFTWTLPCLSGEPCTGPHGTNVVRSPDGVHFCPDGKSTLVGYLEECDVYSSGAVRFASAMLKWALTPPVASSPPAPPAAVCGGGHSNVKKGAGLSNVKKGAGLSNVKKGAGLSNANEGTGLPHVKRSAAEKRTHALAKECREPVPSG
jgi:hypothetical protein